MAPHWCNVLFKKGDLVQIRSWRENDIKKVGVVVRPVKNSYVSDFSRYEILVGKKVLEVRSDMLLKVKDK